MKTGTKYLLLLPVIFTAAFTTLTVNGQTNTGEHKPVSEELYRTIAKMDSILFAALNTRDIAKMKTLFTEDLEFYHDKGGLTGYQYTIDFAASLAKNNSDLKRELIPGSLEVYPVKDYGAIQTGRHRFCHTENGKWDCGTFKFVHVWKKTNDGWKVSRILSYDH